MCPAGGALLLSLAAAQCKALVPNCFCRIASLHSHAESEEQEPQLCVRPVDPGVAPFFQIAARVTRPAHETHAPPWS